jgi:hypothetical protein
MKISLSSCSWIEPEGAIDEALTAPSPAATASVVANNMVLSPTWLLAWSSFVAAMRRRQPRGGATMIRGVEVEGCPFSSR